MSFILSFDEGYHPWLAESSGKKEAPSFGAYSVLKAYVDGKYDVEGKEDLHTMKGCTFRYIIDYYLSGGAKKSPRFSIACADYGYTEAELSNLFFTEKKTPKDIAKEIIDRPRDEEEDY